MPTLSELSIVITKASALSSIPVDLNAAIVPSEVNELAVTPLARVAPVKVPAAAVTVIAAEPSKFTPLIALAVAKAVAVEALPVNAPVIGPANPVAVSIPVLELNVRFVPLLGGRPPVAAVTNKGKQVVSLDSSATVTFVAVVAVGAIGDINKSFFTADLKGVVGERSGISNLANIDKEGLKKPIYESTIRSIKRGVGPEEACGFFCDNAGFWAGGGGNDWDPGIGCLQDTYNPTSMTGDWQNNWWTSNLYYDYY